MHVGGVTDKAELANDRVRLRRRRRRLDRVVARCTGRSPRTANRHATRRRWGRSCDRRIPSSGPNFASPSTSSKAANAVGEFLFKLLLVEIHARRVAHVESAASSNRPSADAAHQGWPATTSIVNPSGTVGRGFATAASSAKLPGRYKPPSHHCDGRATGPHLTRFLEPFAIIYLAATDPPDAHAKDVTFVNLPRGARYSPHIPNRLRSRWYRLMRQHSSSASSAAPMQIGRKPLMAELRRTTHATDFSRVSGY